MRTPRRGHRRPHRGLGRPPSSQPGKGYPPAGPGRALGRPRFTLHFSERRIHQRKRGMGDVSGVVVVASVDK